MSESKELKPKSFRIDDKTASDFKRISEKIGGNQQETLAKLIEAYEFQSGKVTLSDYKADIEQYEAHITAITRMYMGRLEDMQQVRETVRAEFDALLQSKDKTIQSLQDKLETQQAIAKQSVSDAQHYESDNISLKQSISDFQAMMSDKDKLNAALANRCTDLEMKVKKMADIDKLQQDLSAANKKIQELELSHKMELLDLESRYRSQVNELIAKHQDDIDKYQKKYLDLLNNQTRAMAPNNDRK